MKKLWLVLPVVFWVACSATPQDAEFQISVSNRTGHALMLYANGKEQGEVLAGHSKAFVVALTIINNGGITSPTPSAQAVFTARDLVTGKLSGEKRPWLVQDRPENIEFTPRDFQ